MSARSRTIPNDVKLTIPADSRWARHPRIFGGIGLAALLMSFVLSSVQHGKASGDHHGGGKSEQVQHQEGGRAADGHAAVGDGAAHDGHEVDAKNGSGDGHHGPTPPRFWFSYLTAYMYGLSLALGALFFVIIQFLAKAGWSVVVRRVAENVMATLPLFAVLFIPVAIGLPYTHSHWWNVEPGVDRLLDAKSAYLNPGFFFFRAVVYLAVWSGLALLFRRNSTLQDETGDHDITRRLQRYSPVGVILFGFTLTFAAIDWIKSMDPHWYSTMWGVYYFAGCVVSMYATVIVLVLWLQRDGYILKIVSEEHYHDLGKLLFGFTVFWAYISFSQFFLIWYANIPEEQLWFMHRTEHGWLPVGIFLMVGHFFVPFFFLIRRGIKRSPVTLFMAAGWMLFIHYVDLYFQVMPTYGAFAPSAVDLLAWVGVVCLFFATFSYWAARNALVPVKDPRLPESLAFENF